MYGVLQAIDDQYTPALWNYLGCFMLMSIPIKLLALINGPWAYIYGN